MTETYIAIQTLSSYNNAATSQWVSCLGITLDVHHRDLRLLTYAPDDLRQYQLLTVPEIGELQDQIDSDLTRPFLFQVCALCPHRKSFHDTFDDLVTKRKGV